MALGFLGVAASLLAVALVISHFSEQRRGETLETRLREIQSNVSLLMGDIARSKEQTHRLVADVDSTWKSQLGEKYKEQHQFNAHVGREVEKLTKDFEVMAVRQRTLEKRLIGAERVVTVNVHNIDDRKKPLRSRGKGRGALIPENA